MKTEEEKRAFEELAESRRLSLVAFCTLFQELDVRNKINAVQRIWLAGAIGLVGEILEGKNPEDVYPVKAARRLAEDEDFGRACGMIFPGDEEPF